MRREELDELHYITPIENVASILGKGILSHRLAARVPHASVAMQAVQDRRSNKRVPNGRMLHEYANTYFNARNAMMYLRRGARAQLCVLRIRPAIWTLMGLSSLTEMRPQVRVLAPHLLDLHWSIASAYLPNTGLISTRLSLLHPHMLRHTFGFLCWLRATCHAR